MSFRQDRTNPSSAVSNWKGRTNTPKAWPSTSVSTWLNGGLFGGASPGWIAVPSGTNVPWNLYDSYLDGSGNLWIVSTSGDTSNSDAPVGMILADGTVGVANDWKLIDATNTRPAYCRGVCVNGSDVFVYFQTANVSNYQMGFTCGFTPGTLAPDYNKSFYESGGRDFYGHVGAIRPWHSNSNIVAGYGYNSSYNRFHAYISMIGTSDGVVEVLNGGTADTILFESNSGANSVYPILADGCKLGDYILVGMQYQADRFGWLAQNSTNSTSYRQYYTDSGGSLANSSGGVTADTQSTTHLYMTCKNDGNEAQIAKIKMSDGSLTWNRKIEATTSPSGISSISAPIVDSSGNVYFAWAQYDNNAAVVDTAYRIHWVKYDTSGNVQQIDSQNTRCLFLSPEHGQPVYSVKVSLDSNEEFIYITAYNNAGTPIAAKLPLDGSGTQSGAYSVGGKSFYYRNDVATTDAAGTLTAAGTDGSYATNNETTQINTGFNAAAQMGSPAVASIQVGG